MIEEESSESDVWSEEDSEEEETIEVDEDRW